MGVSSCSPDVSFSPDGKQFMTGVNNMNVRFWDVKTGKRVRRLLKGHTAPITAAAYCPNGKMVVTGSEDGTLRIWNLQTCQQIGEPIESVEEGEFGLVAVSPDGKRVAAAEKDSRTVRIWDVETHQQVGQSLAWHSKEVTCIAFSHDGKMIVTGSHDWALRIWDVETGHPLGSPLPGISLPGHAIAFSSDDKRIISSPPCNPLRIWDISGLKL